MVWTTILLGHLLVLPVTRPLDLARLMVEEPVGLVLRDKVGTCVWDFAKGEALFKLPDPYTTELTAYDSDCTYDPTGRELFALQSYSGHSAALLIGQLPPSGSRVTWRTLDLPPRTNWIHPPQADADIPQGEIVPQQVFVNRKYIVIVYEGPRLRAFDRTSLRPVAESVFGDPSGPYAFAENRIINLALGRADLTFAACSDNHFSHNQLPSEIRVGRIGGRVLKEEISSNDPARNANPGAQPDPESVGIVPRPDGGWGVLSTDGWMRSYRPTSSGWYRRVSRFKFCAGATSWAFDGATQCAYSFVGRENFEATGQHLSYLRAGARFRIGVEASTLLYEPLLSTFGKSRWLVEMANLKEGEVIWHEKLSDGKPVYRFKFMLHPKDVFIGIHG